MSGAAQLPGANQRGLTLIELVMVIILIGVLGSAAVSSVSSIGSWRHTSAVREFSTTWEFLFQEAFARGNAYRLVIDLDENAYYVRREILKVGTSVTQVDYLKNLRTQGEQRRRAEEQEEEEVTSLDEAFRAEDARTGGPLAEVFYRSLYADPHGGLELTVPLAFPSLGERSYLPYGLSFDRVITRRGEVREGRTFIRFSPRGASDFAVVYVRSGEEDFFTVFMNPATGRLSIKSGEHDIEWQIRGSDQQNFG